MVMTHKPYKDRGPCAPVLVLAGMDVNGLRNMMYHDAL